MDLDVATDTVVVTDGLPRWYFIKTLPANAGDLRDMVQSLGREDPLEDGMATYSVFLPRESPWPEGPDGLQTIGSQRIRRN